MTKGENIMQDQLTIKEQFVVNKQIFHSREQAQAYVDNIKKQLDKNEYHNTIYYENWTTTGEEAERQACHARWQTFQEALDDMSNYANSWRPKGTGWINKVTLTTNPNGSIKIKTEKHHERN